MSSPSDLSCQMMIVTRDFPCNLARSRAPTPRTLLGFVLQLLHERQWATCPQQSPICHIDPQWFGIAIDTLVFLQVGPCGDHQGIPFLLPVLYVLVSWYHINCSSELPSPILIQRISSSISHACHLPVKNSHYGSLKTHSLMSKSHSSVATPLHLCSLLRSTQQTTQSSSHSQMNKSHSSCGIFVTSILFFLHRANILILFLNVLSCHCNLNISSNLNIYRLKLCYEYIWYFL